MQVQSDIANDVLTDFFQSVKNDGRLSSTHVSICFVLFRYWMKNNYQNPITITRKKVMLYAKIRSTAIYHKVIQQLEEFGYITYTPSFHPNIGSTITFNPLNPL